MKIEKINEYQVRCILSQQELTERHISLSEMKYGKPGTIRLFQEVIREAARKYNFNEEGLCLMIDATPLNTGSLVLVLTKVRNPEELDARFSRFSPELADDGLLGDSEDDDIIDGDAGDNDGDDGEAYLLSTPLQVLENFIDFLNKCKPDSNGQPPALDISIEAVGLSDDGVRGIKSTNKSSNTNHSDSSDMKRVSLDVPTSGKGQKDADIYFRFESMRDLMIVASPFKQYVLPSYLYRSRLNDSYILKLHCCDDNDQFHRLCNNLSEFGTVVKGIRKIENSLAKDYELILDGNAIESISRVL